MKRILPFICNILFSTTIASETIIDSSHIIGIEAMLAPTVFDGEMNRRIHTESLANNFTSIDHREEIDSICNFINKLEEQDWLTHSPYIDSEQFKITGIGYLVTGPSPAKYTDLSLVIYYDDGRLPDLFWDSHYVVFKDKYYKQDVRWKVELRHLISRIGKKNTDRAIIEEWTNCKIITADVEWIYYNFLPKGEISDLSRSEAINLLTLNYFKRTGVCGYVTDKTKIENILNTFRELPYRKTNFYSTLETGYQATFNAAETMEWIDSAENVIGYLTIKRANCSEPLELIWINSNETIDRGYFTFGFSDELRSIISKIYSTTFFDTYKIISRPKS